MEVEYGRDFERQRLPREIEVLMKDCEPWSVNSKQECVNSEE